MKDWQILLAVLVGVLVLRFLFRERFLDSPIGVRGPPYNDDDIKKILGMTPTALKDFIVTSHKNTTNQELDLTKMYDREKWFSYLNFFFVEFYSSVYSPATTPITVEQVNSFIDSKNTPGGAAQKGNIKTLMKKYFVDQPPGPANVGPTGSTGTTQQSSSTSTGSTGTTQQSQSSTTSTGSTGTTQQSSTTSTGSTGTTQQSSTTSTDSMETTTTAGQLTGNQNTTTGGSTTSAWGPSGSETAGGRGFNVFGPLFAGVGEGGGYGSARDSTKENSYPELIGGHKGSGKTRVDGLGMINPSINAPGMNVNLPDFSTLGRSLMPGDKDPYRVSQTFSPSSYSSRGADPVPFLTDFSAFLK